MKEAAPISIVAVPTDKSSKFRTRRVPIRSEEIIAHGGAGGSANRNIVADPPAKGKSDHEENSSLAAVGWAHTDVDPAVECRLSDMGARRGADAAVTALPGTPAAVHSAVTGISLCPRACFTGSNLGATRGTGGARAAARASDAATVAPRARMREPTGRSPGQGGAGVRPVVFSATRNVLTTITRLSSTGFRQVAAVLTWLRH